MCHFSVEETGTEYVMNHPNQCSKSLAKPAAGLRSENSKCGPLHIILLYFNYIYNHNCEIPYK